ncbi:MAG: biopolymer transporter ExbD [Chitinophagales bacterium]|jgi:biopolymer transport protein ExbD|nr:biopolymer transporter ExbD [Chitinophagales bacterium]
MAEMNVPESGGKKKHAKKRSKKMSTRVDLTAMVDLGFLLITFFMLTTTFNKPQAMEVNMPEKDDVKDVDRTKIKESEALSIVLVENDVVYFYVGLENPMVDSTNFSKEGIRKIILGRQQEVEQTSGNKDNLTVLIKAKNKAKYKNMVDILDEMAITGVKRYAILDFVKADSMIIYNTVGKAAGQK